MRQVDRRMTIAFAVLLLALGGCAHAPEPPAPPTVPPTPANEHRLIFIEPGPASGTVTLRVGDMLQIAPFVYPLNPTYLGAKLSIKLEGDRALAVIGQSPAGNNLVGAGRPSAFIYAYAPGQCRVRLALLGDGGKPLPDYGTTYEVQVIPAGG